MHHTRSFSFLIVTLVVFLSSHAGIAVAQTEMWDTYITKINNKPATILLDMGQILNAPDHRFPYLVVTGPIAQKADKNGIPGNDEINAMEEILDATGNFLTGVTSKVLVGTLMYNNQRNNYYYVKDTMNVRNAVMRMYNRNYKDYKFSLAIKPDPQWLTYRTFLYPNDETQNWMDNNKVITALLQSGDSLKKERTITFAACFESDTARKSFASFATGKGYTIDKTPETKSADAPMCILFSKYSAVKVDSINIVTAELRDEVKKHKGLYNGWVAPLKAK